MELALSLPFLCVVLLAVVQVAVVARDRVAVQLAAREAARAASVALEADGNAASAAVRAANRAIGLHPLRVEVIESAGVVTVRVDYSDPTAVPLVGAVLAEVVVSASVTMAVEPPDPQR